jgi:hypothetical protein
MITIFGMACQVSKVNDISTIVTNAIPLIMNIKNANIFQEPILKF